MFLTDFFNETRARLILLAKKGLQSNPPSQMEGDLSLADFNIYLINKAYLKKIHNALTDEEFISLETNLEVKKDSSFNNKNLLLINKAYLKRLYNALSNEEVINLEQNRIDAQQIIRIAQGKSLQFVRTDDANKYYEIADISTGGNFRLQIRGSDGASNSDTLLIGGTLASTAGNLQAGSLKSHAGTLFAKLSQNTSDSASGSTHTIVGNTRHNDIPTFKNFSNFEQPLRDSASNNRITFKPSPLSTEGHIEFNGRIKTTEMIFTDGNQGANKVLTSDADGKASWQDIPTPPSNPSLRYYSKIIKFGANDGTADYYCDGVNDEVEIVQALNDLISAGGGTLFIRKGTYNLQFNMSFEASTNIEIRGEENTILNNTNNYYFNIDITNNAYVKFSNITLNNIKIQVVSNYTATTIHFENCKINNNITNNYFFYHPINNTNTILVIFNNCIFNFSTNTRLNLGDKGRLYFTNNYVIDNSFDITSYDNNDIEQIVEDRHIHLSNNVCGINSIKVYCGSYFKAYFTNISNLNLRKTTEEFILNNCIITNLDLIENSDADPIGDNSIISNCKITNLTIPSYQIPYLLIHGNIFIYTPVIESPTPLTCKWRDNYISDTDSFYSDTV